MHPDIQAILRDLDSDATDNGGGFFGWTDGLGFLREKENTSRETQEDKLSDELAGIRMHTLGLGTLSIYAWQSTKEENSILRSNFQAKDIYFAAWLTNITNTALAIVRLAVDGFDTQARCLFRCLQERTKQMIILFYSDDDYRTWHDAFDAEESKTAFYDLFSKKGRLGRRLVEVELALGFHFPQEILDARKSDETFYSQSVHGASSAVLVGSWGAEYVRDRLYPATFGFPSRASLPTLSNTFWDLLTFQHLLKELLKQVHGWDETVKHDFVSTYCKCREATRKIASVLLTKKNDSMPEGT